MSLATTQGEIPPIISSSSTSQLAAPLNSVDLLAIIYIKVILLFNLQPTCGKPHRKKKKKKKGLTCIYQQTLTHTKTLTNLQLMTHTGIHTLPPERSAASG